MALPLKLITTFKFQTQEKYSWIVLPLNNKLLIKIRKYLKSIRRDEKWISQVKKSSHKKDNKICINEKYEKVKKAICLSLLGSTCGLSGALC